MPPEQINFYESFIQNIGEPYLRVELEKMLNKMKGISLKERLKNEYLRERDYYQRKLDDLEENETD